MNASNDGNPTSNQFLQKYRAQLAFKYCFIQFFTSLFSIVHKNQQQKNTMIRVIHTYYYIVSQHDIS